MPVLPVGVEVDGAMEVPLRPRSAGTSSARRLDRPDRRSSLPMSTTTASPGAFFRLRELEIGAPTSRSSWRVATGRSFVVTELLRSQGPSWTRTGFARSGAARLVLITCGGEFDRPARSYRDNVVAIAERVG